MKNKLIFRIFGALASALIIAAVFVPFISVAGYSESLWGLYSSESIYLPIMIIAFGVIGVIFFSLNIKTEFAYISVGAIAFFIIMRTVDIINQGAFGTLSLGYYFLVAGTVLLAIITFFCNLNSKKNNEQKLDATSSEPKDILNQIDKLYDGPQDNNQISPIQPLQSTNNVGIEPQPISSLSQSTVQPISPIPEPVNPIQTPIPEPINPVVPDLTPVDQAPAPVATPNPVVQDLTPADQAPAPVAAPNPVVQDLTPADQAPVAAPNPVVQDLTPVDQAPVPVAAPNPVVQDLTPVDQAPAPVAAPNPVVQGLTPADQAPAPVAAPNPVVQDLTPATQDNANNQSFIFGPSSDSNNASPVSQTNQQGSNSPGVDIFGQPLR